MPIELIIARSQAAKLLEAAEEALNRVALGVAYPVMGSWKSPLASGWNHDLRTAFVKVLAELPDEVHPAQQLIENHKRQQFGHFAHLYTIAHIDI